MRGLRKREDDKFENFFELVEKKAMEDNSWFFCDSEEGHDAIIDDFDMCDLFGWLIPIKLADEFEFIWRKAKSEVDIPDEWDKFTTFAEWNKTQAGEINVSFVDHNWN